MSDEEFIPNVIWNGLCGADEDEAHLMNPLTPQQIKCLPKWAYPPQARDDATEFVIADLLNALAVKLPNLKPPPAKRTHIFWASM